MAEGKKLVLGGVEIPHDKGLEGHSDADVLLHALADALLGAAALGDIGKHFPDNDPRYKDISSLLLLQHVADLLAHHRYTVINVDMTLALEKPKIGPYATLMQQNIATVLHIPVQQVSIKATTHEGLGFIGTELGAAAYAVASVFQQ